MSSSDASATGPGVLFAHFTFTEQSLNVDGTPFSFAGGQVRSLPGYVEQAQASATGLADGLVHGSKTGSALPRTEHKRATDRYDEGESA